MTTTNGSKRISSGKSSLRTSGQADSLLLGSLLADHGPSKIDRRIPSSARDPQALMEDRRFECDQLRKEILQNDQITIQIMTFVLTAIGAIMGVTFYAQQMEEFMRAFLLLLAAFVGFVGLYLETDRVYAIYVIGSYIKHYIEPQTEGIRWETRIAAFREKTKKTGYMTYEISQKWIYYVVIVTNVLIALYYFYRAYSSDLLVYITIAIIAVLICSLLLYFDWRRGALIGDQHTSTFDRVWEEVEYDEQHSAPPAT